MSRPAHYHYRRRYLRGMGVLVTLAGPSSEGLLVRLLPALSQPIREDDADVRKDAESCCFHLGSQVRCGAIRMHYGQSGTVDIILYAKGR